MKLDYSTFGLVKITTLDCINEILGDFDKVHPTGGGTKSSSAPAIILRLTKTVKVLMQNKL